MVCKTILYKSLEPPLIFKYFVSKESDCCIFLSDLEQWLAQDLCSLWSKYTG